MKKLEKFRKYMDVKKCPRCGTRCLKTQERCEECDLIFARLEYASNKAAKRQLLKFDRDYIIYTNQFPKDIKRWKLWICAVLFGIMGGHYYYVGKYIKGILMTLSFAYLVACTILNPYIVEYMETNYLYFPIGIAAGAWLVSLVYLFSNKFTVPVMIDTAKLEADRNAVREDFNKTKAELQAENKKARKKKGDILADKTEAEEPDKKDTESKKGKKTRKKTQSSEAKE